MTATDTSRRTARGGRAAAGSSTGSTGSTAVTAAPRGLGQVRARLAALAGLFDRPYASYYLVLGSAGLLLVLGLIMVLSASSVQAYAEGRSPYYYFQRQAIWTGLGLVALWVAAKLPVRLLRRIAFPAVVVTAVLLAAVLVPGLGHEANGAQRWLQMGPFVRIQPSELAKLALVLWGADLLARRKARREITEWRTLLVPLIPGAGLLVALIMLGDDLGTTLVLLTVLLALLWVVGAPIRLFAVMFATMLALVVGLIAVEPYRMARLTSFTDPFATAQAGGYQAVQGIYAIATGGIWGVGLGGSREKWGYLPHNYTDFIFAIIGEELGLIGTLVVLALFALLGYAGFRIAKRMTDPFLQLVAGAVTAWLLVQALVNVGAVIGVLPITGIPLPLVSYGGSALLPTMVGLGLLLSFARQEPGARKALAGRSRAAGRTGGAGAGAGNAASGLGSWLGWGKDRTRPPARPSRPATRQAARPAARPAGARTGTRPGRGGR